jgi:hypothetical protein
VARRTRLSHLTLLALLAGASLGAPARATAQLPVLLQGLADAELWKTDSGSRMLTRNAGHTGTLERVHLWGAAELPHDLVLYAAGNVESGGARLESGTEWDMEQAGVRYAPSEAVVLDVGMMPHPVGAFASRRYSFRNPLIGVPDGYPVEYPVGVQLSGVRGRVDYRSAIVSLPVYHERYTPDPTPTPRPALGGGVTVATGVRLGASVTWGPYLGSSVPQTGLGGRSWRDFAQRIGALDAQFSRGYLELRGELARSEYDVPGGAPDTRRSVRGLTYYTEARYTVTPRLFLAARAERNDYPYIVADSAGLWHTGATDVYNAEVGAGWRLGSATLVKVSLRQDRWRVPREYRAAFPNGRAFGLQFSRAFDLLDIARAVR